MNKVIELACSWAELIANDNSHGYSQPNRTGNPDYDCSSFVIAAYQQAFEAVGKRGPEYYGATYTENMYMGFSGCGFTDIFVNVFVSNGNGLQRGDILLNTKNHTALYIGDGKIVHARNDDDGVAGDYTTGREITICNYYNYPWDRVLRYAYADCEDEDYGHKLLSGAISDLPSDNSGSLPRQEKPKITPVSGLPLLKKGSSGGAVLSAQNLLIHKWGMDCGPCGADSDFGSGTESAVIKLQGVFGIEKDGQIGPITWGYLLN